jgi:kynurenine 3-monooxygenase
MALLLARRGVPVNVYERAVDPRINSNRSGRSINLALAQRGIQALQQAGVWAQTQPLLIPMRGRMLHDLSGTQTFVPYGQRQDAIFSVSRSGLNRVLVEHAAELPGLQLHFGQRCTGADFERQTLAMMDEHSRRTYTLPLHHVIATDGAGSTLRNAMIHSLQVPCGEEILAHGYKELTLPAGLDGRHALEPQALHVWPRGNFMLIALPNLDGSFTATLFLARDGEPGFSSLESAAQVREFLRVNFPDALQLMPDACREFFAHPVGIMGTIRCERWSVADALTLLGDAAHAIVPFHGQGMNCAFEDCSLLDTLLTHSDDWADCFSKFEQQRRPDTDAIAAMALENYLQMRDTVREPKFQLQNLLALELERRYPERFVPRYSMVMFHAGIPYSAAYERGRIQGQILDELTGAATQIDDIDFTQAQALINARLAPIGVTTDRR